MVEAIVPGGGYQSAEAQATDAPSNNATSAGVSNTGTLEPAPQSNATSVTPPAAGPPSSGPPIPIPNVPAPGQENAPASLPENIANQMLPGGPQISSTGATPAKPARQLDEAQLVQEIANAIGVKKPKNGTLEQKVIDTLAQKFGVKIKVTSTAQGGAAGLRHDIAGWFDDTLRGAGGVATAIVEHAGTSSQDKMHRQEAEGDEGAKYQEALKIKSPVLRQQALQNLAGQGSIQQVRDQIKGGRWGNTVPDQSKQALSDMLGNVAEKLGINTSVEGQTGLSQIAERLGVPTESLGTPALPGTTGQQMTAQQAYVELVKGAYDSKGDLTKTGQAWATQLENAGYLNANYGNDVTQGTGVTAALAKAPVNRAQLDGAFQNVVTAAVTQKKSIQAVLAAGPPGGIQNEPAAAQSEMTAYVQGVATEFGVGLNEFQINYIANQFGADATTAADPASVEDQIKDAVVALYNPDNPNNPAGVANTMFTDIQQQALAYQIPISKEAISNMVKQDLQGATVESMYVAADAAESKATELFQQQAAGLYPTLAAQIKAGNTVQNLVSPYFQVAQSYTGVPASTMMADNQGGGVSKWSKFLQGGTDPQSGAPTTQTLDQWKKTLMTDPVYGFDKTQGARDMAEQLSTAILNEFGKVNTGGPEQALNNYNPQTALEANTT